MQCELKATLGFTTGDLTVQLQMLHVVWGRFHGACLQNGRCRAIKGSKFHPSYLWPSLPLPNIPLNAVIFVAPYLPHNCVQVASCTDNFLDNLEQVYFPFKHHWCMEICIGWILWGGNYLLPKGVCVCVCVCTLLEDLPWNILSCS